MSAITLAQTTVPYTHYHPLILLCFVFVDTDWHSGPVNSRCHPHLQPSQHAGAPIYHRGAYSWTHSLVGVLRINVAITPSWVTWQYQISDYFSNCCNIGHNGPPSTGTITQCLDRVSSWKFVVEIAMPTLQFDLHSLLYDWLYTMVPHQQAPLSSVLIVHVHESL